MKHFDPAATATEQHYRATEIAAMYAIGYTTALRRMKLNPKCKYLDCPDRSGRVRRTPLLPESALKDFYVKEMVK